MCVIDVPPPVSSRYSFNGSISTSVDRGTRTSLPEGLPKGRRPATAFRQSSAGARMGEFALKRTPAAMPAMEVTVNDLGTAHGAGANRRRCYLYSSRALRPIWYLDRAAVWVGKKCPNEYKPMLRTTNSKAGCGNRLHEMASSSDPARKTWAARPQASTKRAGRSASNNVVRQELRRTTVPQLSR